MEVEDNNCLDDTEGPSEMEKEGSAVLTTLAGVVANWRQQMYLLASYYALEKQKAKRINRELARKQYIQTLTSDREAECISQLRMKTSTFGFLCHTLREKGHLTDTREVPVEEAVAEFMHTISHSVRNRTNSVRFSRSSETISRHFQAVLHAINQLAPDMLTQAGSHTLPGPYGFKGCVGALDGTHVPVHVPLQNHGWEGSATDARVLHNALICTDPLIVPQAMSTDYDLSMAKDTDVSNSKGKQVKKYVTFNAVMDEEMLDLMLEQVLLGRKAERGFKAEAYESVATAMTANSNGEYVLNGQSVSNRCKHHKRNHSKATEMLNASGFGFDNTTKRIIASDDVWKAWLEGHPNAKPWKSKIIDYD